MQLFAFWLIYNWQLAIFVSFYKKYQPPFGVVTFTNLMH